MNTAPHPIQIPAVLSTVSKMHFVSLCLPTQLADSLFHATKLQKTRAGHSICKNILAALPRSVSTPGLLESEGRVPLEEMWLAPPAPTSRSPDTNSVESR